MKFFHHNKNGFSLVEVIVVAAVSTLIFGALFASFQFTIELMNNSKAKLSALSLANDRLEYIRSLSYDDVGTFGGIPSGMIPQNSTTTLNGIVFSERVLIEYVDDPADGLETATTSDSNGISADYKRVKVEYTWTIASSTNSIFLISNIVPRGIESVDGGGSIRVTVIDEGYQFLPGATVRLVNNSITPPIDITRATNAQGVVLFSGAPAGSNYQVFANGSGYSIDQTYESSSTNPLPELAPFSVVESDLSPVTLRIDELSDLDIFLYSDITEGSQEETFGDSSGIVSAVNTSVAGGGLELLNTAGSYATNGVAYLTAITPGVLAQWETLRVAASLPAGSNFVVRVYTDDGTGTYTLIPDSELTGNSTGFTDSLIDLRDLMAVTYPEIIFGITLTTSDTTVTPRIDELEVFYRVSESVMNGVSVEVSGNKSIGTDLDLVPIKKYSSSQITNGSGRADFDNLEFDTYAIGIPAGYSVATACPANPYYLTAGVSDDVYLTLVSAVTNSLRVKVIDELSRPIPGAEVTLERSGFNEVLRTNSCGQAFFAGIAPESDYEIEVSLLPYTTLTQTAVNGADNRDVTITMTE